MIQVNEIPCFQPLWVMQPLIHSPEDTLPSLRSLPSLKLQWLPIAQGNPGESDFSEVSGQVLLEVAPVCFSLVFF